MPSLRVKIETHGAIVSLAVGVSLPRAIALSKAGLLVPNPVMILGLIDTGASCTCVDPKIIAQLGMPPTGAAPMHSASTAGTPQMCNQFDATVYIQMDNSEFHVASHPPAHVIPIIECDLSGCVFQALIGRDILDHSMMIYEGPSRSLTISF